MRFLHYPLNFQERGKVVEFTIQGNSCNVKLLDEQNFYNYKNGKKHEYFGGRVTQSPAHITVPESKVWHAVVDFGGYSGTANVSFKV